MAVSQESAAAPDLAIPADAERFYVNVPYQSRAEFLRKNLKHVIFLSSVGIALVVGIFTAHTLLLMAALITSVVSFFVYLTFDKLPSDAIDGAKFLLSSRKDNRVDQVYEAYTLDLKRTDDVLRWTGEIIDDSMYHLRFTRSSEFYSPSQRGDVAPYTCYDVTFVPDMYAAAVAIAGLVQASNPVLHGDTPLSAFQDYATQWNPNRAMYMLYQSMTLNAVLSDMQYKRAFVTGYKNPDIPSQLANLVGLLASAYAEIRGLDAQGLNEALRKPVFEAIASRSIG